MRPSPDCRLCTLSQNRSRIVLPEGDPCSPVVFVGEAPGEKEDQSGRPFVGRSGRILDGMLEEAGLPRGSILITNTVKCRPPGNRDPQREEMAACLPFLQHELKDRELVVGLGKSACRDLMGMDVKMKEVANKETAIDVDGKKVAFMPTYHPAATIYSKEAREALRHAVLYVKKTYYDL